MAKTVRVLLVLLALVGVFVYVALGFLFVYDKTSIDPGVRAVELMYDYDTPAELLQNQKALQAMLTSEDFERLCIDNELRVVNTYYERGYQRSKVRVVEHRPGYVLYSVVNANTSPSDLWVFQYSLTDDNRLHDIKEYKLISSFASDGMQP